MDGQSGKELEAKRPVQRLSNNSQEDLNDDRGSKSCNGLSRHFRGETDGAWLLNEGRAGKGGRGGPTPRLCFGFQMAREVTKGT